MSIATHLYKADLQSWNYKGTKILLTEMEFNQLM